MLHTTPNLASSRYWTRNPPHLPFSYHEFTLGGHPLAHARGSYKVGLTVAKQGKNHRSSPAPRVMVSYVVVCCACDDVTTPPACESCKLQAAKPYS